MIDENNLGLQSVSVGLGDPFEPPRVKDNLLKLVCLLTEWGFVKEEQEDLEGLRKVTYGAGVNSQGKVRVIYSGQVDRGLLFIPNCIPSYEERFQIWCEMQDLRKNVLEGLKKDIDKYF